MTRALTSTELEYVRRDGQRAQLMLATLDFPPVYTAQVNGAPSSNDKVAQIDYDNGAGTLAEVLPGMTMYVGTVAGGYDLGMVRIRKDPTAAIFYIGETSKIAWEDDAYLTVVDDIDLWVRQVRIDGTTPYMDYDVAYTNQHSLFDPVPVLGPVAVAELAGATVDVEFDAGDSWVIGSSISAHSWEAPGSSASSGMATATPTITYDAAGSYRVSDTVTAANGKTTTGHRRVYIWDAEHPPVTQFVLESCSGDRQIGGWSFRVRLFDQASRMELRDRGMVVLFAKDWYGATQASIGPVADRENVIAMGWIDGASIEWDPANNSVVFDVQGPQYWLAKLPSFPLGVEDTYLAGVSASWTAISELTVDKGLFHLIHWRSTISTVMDVYPTDDERQIPALESPQGGLWAALIAMCYNTILAQPKCDRYGRLYVVIDINHTPLDERSGIPVVQDIAKNDWMPIQMLHRRESDTVSQVSISGIQYSYGKSYAICARSPGDVFARHGAIERVDSLAFLNVAQAVELAGLLGAAKNNEFESLEVIAGGNQRMTDIAPAQYLTQSIAVGDTERGIVWDTVNLIPRRIAFSHDPASGALSIQWTLEPETGQWNAVQYTCPSMPKIQPFELPAIPLPGFIFLPIPLIPIWNPGLVIYDASGHFYYTNEVDSLNWQMISNNGIDPGDDLGVYNFALDPVDETTVRMYIVGSQDFEVGGYWGVRSRVYRKDNIFDNEPWVVVDEEHDPVYPYLKYTYHAAIGVNPTDHTVLVLVCQAYLDSPPASFTQKLMYSTDFGESWVNGHSFTDSDLYVQQSQDRQLTYVGDNALISFPMRHVTDEALNRVMQWYTTNDGQTVTQSYLAAEGTKHVNHAWDGSTVFSAIENVNALQEDHIYKGTTSSLGSSVHSGNSFWLERQCIGYHTNGYVLVARGRGSPNQDLLRSVNDGASFSLISPPSGLTKPKCVRNVGDKDVWFVGGEGGIFRTENAGSSWVDRTGVGLPSSPIIMQIEVLTW